MPPACDPRAAAELEAFNPGGAGDRAFRGPHAGRAAVAPVSVRGDIGGVGKAWDRVADGRAGSSVRIGSSASPAIGCGLSFPRALFLLLF